jgi:hypothetical protein
MPLNERASDMPPSWTINPNLLDGFLKAATAFTPFFLSFLAWIAAIGGLRTLSGWLSSLEEPMKGDAINRIKKGLTAAHPDANALECVNELVAGLDQWQLASHRTKGRIEGLRRSVAACLIFLLSLGGGWVCSNLGEPARSFEQALLVLCLLSFLGIVFYGYPLISLVIENGLPSREVLSGKTQAVPISNTVSATEAATTHGVKPSPASPSTQLPATASAVAAPLTPVMLTSNAVPVIMATAAPTAQKTPSQLPESIAPLVDQGRSAAQGATRKRRRA